MLTSHCLSFFFFFNDTATTEIYTLSLHDALPIYKLIYRCRPEVAYRPITDLARSPTWQSILALDADGKLDADMRRRFFEDRKSTRLNSSHANISYAVFCLKKKKKIQNY